MTEYFHTEGVQRVHMHMQGSFLINNLLNVHRACILQPFPFAALGLNHVRNEPVMDREIKVATDYSDTVAGRSQIDHRMEEWHILVHTVPE